VLAVQYRAAKAQAARFQQLRDRGSISFGDWAEANNKVEVLRGQIAGLRESWNDELELLRVRRARAQAEVEKAKAQLELAQAKVAINTRLHDRLKGSVISEDEVRQTEGVARVARAALQVTEADLLEVETRIRQAERRVAALARLTEDGEDQPAQTKAGR
jgi:multidrug resistance efflux pump